MTAEALIAALGVISLVFITIIGWVLRSSTANLRAHSGLHDKINAHGERLARIEERLKIKNEE